MEEIKLFVSELEMQKKLSPVRNPQVHVHGWLHALSLPPSPISAPSQP